MGSDWIHCNACGRQPAQGVVYFISSCGHIICQKCTTSNKVDGKSPDALCPCCSKKCTFIEINRNLRPELQMLFRNPKELATQYMKNLSRVLEFQSSNRTRLSKIISEREKKAVKFASLAQEEIKKRIDLENKVAKEHMRLKCELDMQRMRYLELEAQLAEKEKQIEELQNSMKRAPPIARSDSGIEGEMDADSGLSFLNVATSTPILNNSPMNRFTSTGHRNHNHISDVFANTDKTLPSPITFTCEQMMTTPAMLGLKRPKQGGSFSASRRTPGDKYDFHINVARTE
ncbi:RING-type domain-containing protein [Trichostrongylus colubriformis]|uniref:RING-type domain-containing protein n=1 Tax=Trichostrongylus colubriformis TaxID=6319 RepID=A0AAN8FA47_TRICO